MHHLFTSADGRISGRGVSVFTQGSFPGVTMEKSHPTEMAAEIVSAFVSKNAVPRSELFALFETVHPAVKRLAERGAVAPAAIESPARTRVSEAAVAPVSCDKTEPAALRFGLRQNALDNGAHCVDGSGSLGTSYSLNAIDRYLIGNVAAYVGINSLRNG